MRNTVVIKNKGGKSIYECLWWVLYTNCWSKKERALVNKKGAGKILETNEARFRELQRKHGDGDCENEYISLFQKMGHCFQTLSTGPSQLKRWLLLLYQLI